MSVLELDTQDEDSRIQLDTRKIFSEQFKVSGDFSRITFTDFLDECDKWAMQEAAKSTSVKVTKQALGNARGKWFEWLIAIGFWHWADTQKGVKFTLAQLPNVSSFDSAKLFKGEVYQAIHAFKNKLSESDVTMVTSNPDFVLIKKKPFRDQSIEKLLTGEINSVQLETLSNHYTHFIDSCSLSDIFGYLAVKSSMRPDRRLQIAHEGSTYKALSKNISNALNQEVYIPRFFAIASATTDSDRNALKTVATHSIAENGETPTRAVDRVYDVNGFEELCNAMNDLQTLI